EDCQGVMATCDMGEVVEVEERFYPGVILGLQDDCSTTETTSMNNNSRVDVSFLGGLGTQCRRQRFLPSISGKRSEKSSGLPILSKNYKVLSEMLEDFDRQDVMDIHRKVQRKVVVAFRPEGIRIDAIVHILLMQNGIAIHMLTEKKYPLSQEMLSKMLSKRLKVDHESTQAYELLKIDQGVGSTSGIRACALRNFDLEVMELENTQNNALAKLPMLKLGEYEMWEIRIKQYFQIQDYALWEVIENGNSWVPIPVTAPKTGPSTATKMTVPSTAEEKTCKKNDVKARSLLLMALPNEHQLTFDQYVDAQSMFAAIKARFGGNEATKKT
ncbi:hypothetical protein Tco_1217437, partial [Tanacetum coccineum]